MTRTPKAFQSVVALLGLWITGRALTMMPEFVEADAVRTGEPERSATEDPAELTATIAEAVAKTPAPDQDPFASPRGVASSAGANFQLAAHGHSLVTMSHSVVTAEGERPAPVRTDAESARLSPVLTPLAPGSPVLGFAFDEGWSASGWTLYRPGSRSGSALAANGQLGGSQAGVRVRKALFDVGAGINLGGSVRASSGLSRSAQREIAIGVSIRTESQIPVEFIAERRIGVDGGARGRFAMLAATGVDDVELPAGALLSGYAQAGVAGVRGRDGFADGAVRIERPLDDANRYEVRAGVNLWGAAQPGLSRVDVGPSVSLKVQSFGAPMRISAEWRQRVAGNASPASGPAITIGADF